MSELNLFNLFPSHFFTLTNEGFSGTIVLILGVIFIGFIIKTLRDFFIARKQITFYLHKFRQLKPVAESDNFIANWRAITNEVKQEQKYGSLWNEFAESLVTAQRSSEAFPRYYNVFDAEHFFNTHTLAPKLTENRLLATVPGILTAIGVLGTFSGLQFGLGDFTGLGENPSVDDLKKAVFGMIGGAGIAFMTSVWGVLLSLIFNFTEKLLERSIRKDIAELQNEIDYLFPRIIAEQVLSNIETHSAQSRNSLAELGEKIGDRMQEVMNGVSETISSEIARTLSEAMKELADKASTSSESALETLIQEFSAKIGSAGEEQRLALQEATANLSRLPEMLQEMLAQTQIQLAGGISKQQEQDAARQQLLDNSLTNFMADLKGQFSQISEENAKREEKLTEESQGFLKMLADTLQNMESHSAETLRVLDERLSKQAEANAQQVNERASKAEQANLKFMQDLAENMRQFVAKNSETSMEMHKAMQEQQSQVKEQDENRQKALHGLVNETQQNQNKLIETLQAANSEQKKANMQLITELDRVIASFNNLIERHQQTTIAMGNVSQNMNATSTQFNQLSENLKTAVNDFGTKLNTAVLAAQATATRQSESMSLFDKVNAQFGTASQAVEKTAESLEKTAQSSAKSVADTRAEFKQFNQELAEHIGKLNEQVANLLNEYATQVKGQMTDRLNQWNNQTSEYTSTMSNAISALSSVVDEIESKVGRR